MKALIFDIRLNSLFSIRIPFTWQSALTYPLLPPSAVIGMLANALQRYKNNKHPLDYLSLLESYIKWAGSRLITPCVVKSYTTSAIVKWEDKLGGKFTNALGRQYGFAKKIRIMAILENNKELIKDLILALKTTPLTCGDSESLATVENIEITEARENTFFSGNVIETDFGVPFELENMEVLSGGMIYLVHEKCEKKGKKFPLRSYILPIKEEQGILKHVKLEIKLKKDAKTYCLENGQKVIIF